MVSQLIRDNSNDLSSSLGVVTLAVAVSMAVAISVFFDLGVEFNRKLIKKGPNVQLKIDHVLNPTCLVIRQEAQGDHNGHDWQGQKA